MIKEELKRTCQWSALLFVPLLFLGSCNSDSQTSVNFYFFKTSFSLQEDQNQFLENLGSNKLYLRIFDVDVSPTGEVEIVSPIILEEFPDDNLQVVPLIFITNRTFKRLKTKEYLLAGMDKAVTHFLDAFKETEPGITELQFDCDWTASTQAAYFKLLSDFQQKYPHIELTSTIRLHQLKTDGSMEPPPLKRGVLMCYNTGNIRDIKEENSILNFKVIQTYLPYLKEYPLKLDMALPLFEWGVQYRHGQIVSLLRNVSLNDLINDSLVGHVESNKFQFLESHYFNGEYIYKGDIVRHESVSQEDLVKLSDLLHDYKSGPVEELIFYHLNGEISKKYPVDFLKSLSQKIN